MRKRLSRRLPGVSPHKQIDSQRADFKRLGVFGDWDHPYMHDDAALRSAAAARASARSSRMVTCTSGLKPVHWCLNCRSALAEAEVEYEDRTSTAIDVAFRVVDKADFLRRAGR
jgi:isoleucyl-tRNA synthetase